MRLTLSELARLTDGDIVRGELSSFYDGVAALGEAQAQEISFLGNEKYRAQYLATRAGVVLVPRGLTEMPPPGTAVIAVENPSVAFEMAVRHFLAAVKVFTPGIHPRAVVDEAARLGSVRVDPGAVILAGAEIGDGTTIGPNAVIGEGVKIGRDCHIHANVTIRDRCTLGDRVIIQPGAVIGGDGFGYETVKGRHMKIDQVGIVEIQDDVEVGANTTIDRARFGRTVIGEGSKIDNLVQVGHNVQIGKHNLFVALSGIAGSSRTGDYVVVAAQVGIVGHLTIGDKAILTARTGVTTSIEGGKSYGGFPAAPFMESQKERTMIRKLPDIMKRLKELEKRNPPPADA